jgi:hypothetical protein
VKKKSAWAGSACAPEKMKAGLSQICAKEVRSLSKNGKKQQPRPDPFQRLCVVTKA